MDIFIIFNTKHYLNKNQKPNTMKTKANFSIFIFCLLTISNIYGQNPITMLQHNGEASAFYGQTSFAVAYDASVDGDTLLLTAGGFTPPYAIAKGLTIIGSGFFPDSVSVKKRTTILDRIFILAGADSLYLEGLFVNGDIVYGMSDSINSVKVKRCRLANALFQSTSSSAAKNNCSYEECYFGGFLDFNNYGENLLIQHCILKGNIKNINANAVIDGNIILSIYSSVFCYISTSIIRNNIILATTTSVDHGGNNVFYNNLFVKSSLGQSFSVNNYESNNYYGVVRDSIFVNQTGDTYSFSHDYHLKDTVSYLGTDGTQVGIYGGLLPFKDYGRPSNPQIITKSVDSKTDSDGNLQINFKVEAQEY